MQEISTDALKEPGQPSLAVTYGSTASDRWKYRLVFTDPGFWQFVWSLLPKMQVASVHY